MGNAADPEERLCSVATNNQALIQIQSGCDSEQASDMSLRCWLLSISAHERSVSGKQKKGVMLGQWIVEFKRRPSQLPGSESPSQCALQCAAAAAPLKPCNPLPGRIPRRKLASKATLLSAHASGLLQQVS